MTGLIISLVPRQVRNTLADKLKNAKQSAKERLIRLMQSDSVADIDRALAEYCDADAVLGNTVESLEQHRTRLCLTLSTRMQDAISSMDLQRLAQPSARLCHSAGALSPHRY